MNDRHSTLAALLLLAGIVALPGCSESNAPTDIDSYNAQTADPGQITKPRTTDSELLAPEQQEFWDRLSEHCGKAYAGQVVDVTYHYEDALAGTDVAMYVMSCHEDQMHIPFYVNDNRSRNWILTRTHGTIRLKHDHRYPDGTEEAISQYGGDAPRPGLPTRQIFPADGHTGSILPERADNFWFFDFIDEDTLQYGVHWPKFGHSVRVEFDLSTPIEPPPAPWGFEDGTAAIPDEITTEQQAFWDRLSEHCGNAYRGSVDDATYYYHDVTTASEQIIHFMECTHERIHIPFHVDNDRSRNWILKKADGTIRLEHDHRNADGSEESISQYGGDARRPGLPTRQHFPANEHTAAILPQRADNFWFLDFIADDTLQYGAHWPKAGHSVRISFNLDEPVEPPPAPWGYESDDE